MQLVVSDGGVRTKFEWSAVRLWWWMIMFYETSWKVWLWYQLETRPSDQMNLLRSCCNSWSAPLTGAEKFSVKIDEWITQLEQRLQLWLGSTWSCSEVEQHLLDHLQIFVPLSIAGKYICNSMRLGTASESQASIFSTSINKSGCNGSSVLTSTIQPSSRPSSALWIVQPRPANEFVEIFTPQPNHHDQLWVLNCKLSSEPRDGILHSWCLIVLVATCYSCCWWILIMIKQQLVRITREYCLTPPLTLPLINQGYLLHFSSTISIKNWGKNKTI